ncbi:MAG TPA: YhcH/YjgK/YiaL family protein [Ignavibacteriaceae bacterium]|nr:YhcH/YjgK/YiaL family protein [Ignavibacteriaceae bacterium]
MFVDIIENINKYASLIPYLDGVNKFLLNNNLSSIDPGNYSIKDESAYLIIQKYITNPETEKKWESHRKYIDIQLVLTGFEYIGYCPSEIMKLKEDYNELKDVSFYNEIEEKASRLYIPADTFAVFFPGEAHKPGCHLSEPSSVKKAVFKILNQ